MDTKSRLDLLTIYSRLARLEDEREDIRINSDSTDRLNMIDVEMDELRKKLEIAMNKVSENYD